MKRRTGCVDVIKGAREDIASGYTSDSLSKSDPGTDTELDTYLRMLPHKTCLRRSDKGEASHGVNLTGVGLSVKVFLC